MFEGVFIKLSDITVIVLDADTVLGSKVLICLLGKDGLSGRVFNLEVHETQSGVVVQKILQYLCCFLVKDPFNWAKKPTSVDSTWSTETVSPGLVATKTL